MMAGRPKKKRKLNNEVSTRSKKNHFLFTSRDLPKNTLPTYLQLLEYHYYLRDVLNHPTDIFEKMAIDLVHIWKEKAFIPTITQHSVRNKLIRNLKKVMDYVRKNKSRIEIPASEFPEFQKCFIISKCQCFLKSVNSICKCKDSDKIPEREINFYKNQITKHNLEPDEILYIGSSVDKIGSKEYIDQQKKFEARDLRNSQKKKREEKYQEEKIQIASSLAEAKNNQD